MYKYNSLFYLQINYNVISYYNSHFYRKLYNCDNIILTTTILYGIYLIEKNMQRILEFLLTVAYYA